MNRFLKLFCSFALASLAAVPSLERQSQLWQGGGGVDPQAFGDPLNWTPGDPLALDDDLTIDTGVDGVYPIISTNPLGQYPFAVCNLSIGNGASSRLP